MSAAFQFRLEFTEAGLGGVGAGFGCEAGLPLVVEPDDVTSGGGVVPAQLALFLSQVQVEDGAVVLVGLIAGLFNHDGLVDSF